MRKIIKNKKAVSEIIGTAMLLSMAIALFSIVQLMAYSFPFNTPAPSVRLIGTIEPGNISIVPPSTEQRNISIIHQGGEPLSVNTEIIITINDVSNIVIVDGNFSDYNNDDFWGIGEIVKPPPYSISLDDTVEVTVVESNSVLMRGVLQG